MTERSTTHATFVIEREYPHPPAKVFAAYADPANKAKWFVGPEDWAKPDHRLDFRVGGEESVISREPSGRTHAMRGRYWDIVENARIVMAYEMHMDGTRTSVSLGTTELKLAGVGTRLVYTEQGVFLDGHDNVAERKRGTQELFDKLGAFLER